MIRSKKAFGLGLVAVVGLVGAGELFARSILGLGDPPLTIRDPEIEYMFKPGTYERFGNRAYFNQHSMRSPPYQPDANLKVLVLGDSVINGGALTDQDELATELLRNSLPEGSWVGNVSAGSWGPANMSAYLQRHGTFDADYIFVVLSSHDLNDVPTYAEDLGDDLPETAPVSALYEGAYRYLPRYLPNWLKNSAPSEPTDMIAEKSDGKDELLELVEILKSSGPEVHFFLHPTSDEIQNGRSAEGQYLKDLLSSSGADYTEMALDSANFRDSIHINAKGQRAYARAFGRALLSRH
ncbi:hypothetical protein [Aurantiacibacter hainanensis]|uniref:hypothetical protein n=1 Tax=Aurantiacibacter hainanensis TaxID=3076114 RepID=UPI0030C754A1